MPNYSFKDKSFYYLIQGGKAKSPKRKKFCFFYSHQLEDFADSICESDDGDFHYSSDIPSSVFKDDNEDLKHYKKCIQRRFILRQAERNGDLKVKNGKYFVKNFKYYISSFYRFVNRAGLVGFKKNK